MVCIALLSNPSSTGNMEMLPRIRKFCALRSDIFHYEVEDVGQIGTALQIIARVKPQILVINGGDGTVQATMTEIYHGHHFGDDPPPIAVLPNGKTNLIALDLGAEGDPIKTLERILEIVRSGMADHVVGRELISLSNSETNGRPVLGMFLGGAGLADTILYCRHKVYPLGLPNGMSHALTAMALVVAQLFGLSAKFLPPRARAVRVSIIQQGEIKGHFALLLVTTLQRLLLKFNPTGKDSAGGPLTLLLVEQKPWAMMRAAWAMIRGRAQFGDHAGVHLSQSSEIHIEGDRSSVILDGELFEAGNDRPIVLTPTQPVSFLSLAA